VVVAAGVWLIGKVVAEVVCGVVVAGPVMNEEGLTAPDAAKLPMA